MDCHRQSIHGLDRSVGRGACAGQLRIVRHSGSGVAQRMRAALHCGSRSTRSSGPHEPRCAGVGSRSDLRGLGGAAGWAARKSAFAVATGCGALAAFSCCVLLLRAVAPASAGRSPRSTRGPWGAAGGGRIARRVGRMDASKDFARPRMACRNPRPPHANPRHMDVPRARTRGGLSLAYLSLATQRKVGRAARRAVRKLLIFALASMRRSATTEQEPRCAGVGSRSDLLGLDGAAGGEAVGSAKQRARAQPSNLTMSFSIDSGLSVGA
jgi:hypothetical protein